MALEKNGQDLYAVALELYDAKRKMWKPELHHVHAESSVQAELHFKCAFPNRRTCRVIAAGPAIGFFVEDKQGMILSTD